MKLSGAVYSVLLGLALVSSSSCNQLLTTVQTTARADADSGNLIQAVRDYAPTTIPAAFKEITQANEQAPNRASNSQETETEEQYRSEIAADLVQKDYDALEKNAHEGRAEKTRFAGGVWKLYIFYEGLTSPIVGNQASDSDWNAHIALLKSWASAKPESVSARVALAQTYVNFAQKARGTGYADTVSSDGWKLYGERNALAAATLVDAGKLKEKCPYWYEVMQHVALAQGWNNAQARELLERGAAFEPRFYHFYREYALYLLPKWNGQQGDAGNFAEEMAKRIGGLEGKFVYFEIGSLVRCQCDEDDPASDNLSWPKIKEGYAALGQLYGYSNLKNNRFAHMAYGAGDRDAAREAFEKIGSDWDHTVWGNGARFENAKNWAAGQ